MYLHGPFFLILYKYYHKLQLPSTKLNRGRTEFGVKSMKFKKNEPTWWLLAALISIEIWYVLMFFIFKSWIFFADGYMRLVYIHANTVT